MRSAAEIEQVILDAFAGIERPPISDLLLGGGWEDDDIRSAFSKLKHPSYDFVWEFRRSLSAFSMKGFLYMIPSYSVESLRCIDTELTDCICYRLSAIDPRTEPDLIKLITSKQIFAICAYIRFVGEHYGDRDLISDVLQQAAIKWCVQ